MNCSQRGVTHSGLGGRAAVSLSGALRANDLDKAVQKTVAANLSLLAVVAGVSSIAASAGLDLSRDSGGNGGQSEESGDSLELHFDCWVFGLEKRKRESGFVVS